MRTEHCTLTVFQRHWKATPCCCTMQECGAGLSAHARRHLDRGGVGLGVDVSHHDVPYAMGVDVSHHDVFNATIQLCV